MTLGWGTTRGREGDPLLLTQTLFRSRGSNVVGVRNSRRLFSDSLLLPLLEALSAPSGDGVRDGAKTGSGVGASERVLDA